MVVVVVVIEYDGDFESKLQVDLSRSKGDFPSESSREIETSKVDSSDKLESAWYSYIDMDIDTHLSVSSAIIIHTAYN